MSETDVRGAQRAIPTSVVIAVATWLGATAALQWSVVRFRVPILLALTLAALVLGVAVVQGRRVRLGPRAIAGILLVQVLILWAVPLFTYLSGGWRTAAYAVVTLAGLVGAALLLVASRSRDHAPPAWGAAAFGVAALAHVALTVIAVLGDPAPKIDVWVTLQQGSDVLLRAKSFYSVDWVGSPGIQDAFTYFPWMAVLVAPGRWLAGDVRWALLVWSLLLYAGLWALAQSPRAQGTVQADRAGQVRRGTLAAAGAALVLVSVPGGITQIDQAWTEPVLAALLVWWAVLVRRGQAWWAIVPLALALASKQHMVVLVPLLALCRPFGWRRTVAAGGFAAVLMSPWLLGDFGGLWHDTVTLLVSFHPIRFANTWYLFALNVFGVALPFWVTGLVVLGALGAGCLLVARRRLGPVDTLAVAALVLLAANLVNKQAFYNQFWLSAALVVAALTAAPNRPTGPDEAESAAPVPDRR